MLITSHFFKCPFLAWKWISDMIRTVYQIWVTSQRVQTRETSRQISENRGRNLTLAPFPDFQFSPFGHSSNLGKLRMSTTGIDPLRKICANSESKYIHAPPDLAKWNPIDIYLNWKRPFFSSSHSPALSFRASQNCHVSCTAFVSIFGAYTFSTIGRTGWKPFSGNDSDIWHCQVKANFQWCGKGVQTLKYIFFSKDSYQMYTAIDPIKRNLLSF